MPDTTAPAPAETYRDILAAKIVEAQPERLDLYAWYRGKQAPPVVPRRYRVAYQLLQQMSTNPWAGLVVDTLAGRLNIEGVRTGNPTADVELWRLLRRNHFDADQRLVYTDAMIFDTAYLAVWPDADRGARLVPESSLQVAHLADSSDPRRILAAAKLWLETGAGEWRITVYTPSAIYKWSAPFKPDQRGRNVATNGSTSYLTTKGLEDIAWTRRATDGEDWPAPNNLGEVPFVPFQNRPDLTNPTGGKSEITEILPVLQRTDKLTLDMLLASDFAAFRQKWASGIEIPEDEDGKPVEPWTSAMDRVWISESPDTRFGTFEATDLRPYQEVIDAAINAIAAASKVPSHYLVSGSLVNPPSADTLTAAENGLVAKVKDQARIFGEAAETAIRLAITAAGAAQPDDLAVVWTDPQTRSIASTADAATKLQTIGVPQSELWRLVGASQEDLARWRAEAAADQTLQILLAQSATATDPGLNPETGSSQIGSAPATG